FASPQLPRLLNTESIRDTIVRGVENGMLAYVGKKADGIYEPFYWQRSLGMQDIGICDDTCMIQRSEPGKDNVPPSGFAIGPASGQGAGTPTGFGSTSSPPVLAKPPSPGMTVPTITWKGEIPPQKWMNFYTKVLSKFSTGGGLKLIIRVEVSPPE